MNKSRNLVALFLMALISNDARTDAYKSNTHSYQAKLYLTLDNQPPIKSEYFYQYPAYEEVNCIEETVTVIFKHKDDELVFDDELSEYIDEQLYWKAQELIESYFKANQSRQSGKVEIIFKIFNQPNNRFLFEQAIKEFKSDQYEKSIQLLDLIDSEDSNQVCVLTYLGRSYSELEEYKTSITYFDRAIEISPANDRSYYSRGWRYKKIGEYQKALDDMLISLSIIDYFWETHFQLSQIYSKLDKPLAAINHATIGMKYGKKTTFLERRGWSYIDNDNPELALLDFNKGIDINPELGNLYSGKARSHYDLKQFDEALDSVIKAMLLGEKGRYENILKADILDALAQYQESEKLYLHVIDDLDTNSFAYNNLGFMYIKTKQYEKAVTIYEQGFAKGFNTILMYNNLATAYYLLQQYELAEKTILASMKKQHAEELSYELTMLAQINLAQKKYDLTFESLKKVKALSTSFHDAYYGYLNDEEGNFYSQTLDNLIELTQSKQYEIVNIKALLLKNKQ